MQKRKFRILICIIMLLATLSGCFAGLGDWEYELTDAYTLVRFNAHGIQLVYRNDEADTSEVAINRFYVTDFCMNQDIIGLKGIQTVGQWATDDELNSKDRVYYLVDLESNDISGPYEDEESLWEEANAGENMNQWRSTKNLGS